MFNEAVEAQYHQAKQQQIAENLEVQHLHNAVLENMETWETASVMYMPFDFSKVPVEERKFVRLLAKDLIEVDWSTQSMKNWVTKLQHLSIKISSSAVVDRLRWFLTHAVRVPKTGCWPLTLGWRVQMLPTPSLH